MRKRNLFHISKQYVTPILLVRILVGLVFFFNIQCAIVFILKPASYTYGYELQGTAGEVFLRGMGILFLMWNVPYLFALINPLRYQHSILEAILMQFIGLVGETFIFVNLPMGHTILSQSVMRFIVFDAAGLVGLLLAGWLFQRSIKQLA